jgi:hypothetical protein
MQEEGLRPLLDKALGAGNRHGQLSPLLGAPGIPTKLIELRFLVQRLSHAEGMGEPVSEGVAFTAPFQRRSGAPRNHRTQARWLRQATP